MLQQAIEFEKSGLLVPDLVQHIVYRLASHINPGIQHRRILLAVLNDAGFVSTDSLQFANILPHLLRIGERVRGIGVVGGLWT